LALDDVDVLVQRGDKNEGKERERERERERVCVCVCVRACVSTAPHLEPAQRVELCELCECADVRVGKHKRVQRGEARADARQQRHNALEEYIVEDKTAHWAGPRAVQGLQGLSINVQAVAIQLHVALAGRGGPERAHRAPRYAAKRTSRQLSDQRGGRAGSQ
jgi:hypothetical protein